MSQKNTIHGKLSSGSPRERLLNGEPHYLSDIELLSLILRTGSSSGSVISLSEQILRSVEYDLKRISAMSLYELMKVKGLGLAKASAVVAVFELGKRLYQPKSIKQQVQLNSSKQVFEFMRACLASLGHEEFWVIYLNNANRVLRRVQISKGGITGTLVDIRIVLGSALALSATSMILSHNHPSGSLKPSMADKLLTEKMSKAAKLMDLQVLDHLIITEKAYFSFADEGLIS